MLKMFLQALTTLGMSVSHCLFKYYVDGSLAISI